MLIIVPAIQGNSRTPAEIDCLNAQKEEMSIIMAKDQAEMQEQITLLSNQVAEQIAKRRSGSPSSIIRTVFPVSGKVTILSQQPEENPEEEPGRNEEERAS